MSTIVDSIATAITKMEGANPSLNNPGNIMDLNYYKSTGKFALQQYDSPSSGYNALTTLIQHYIDQGLDLNSFFAKYAPSGHGKNDPSGYANFVSQQTGIPLGVRLSDYINGNGLDVSDSTVDDGTTGSVDMGMLIFIGVVTIIGGVIVARG